MRALLIGGSGHVGAHLARLLLGEGATVRALVRRTSDPRGLAGLAVDRVVGDVLDPESLRDGLRGCTAAFHLAAPTSDEPGLARTVTEGTRNVLDASHRAGVGRLVYTSSIVTVGYSRGPGVLDEGSNVRTTVSDYHRSKWDAERDALEFGARTGLPVVVVNPATVVGPLDYRVTPSNAPIRQCVVGGLPFTFDAGLTVVHAADVARGHLLALRRGRPGERYILGGDRVTIDAYFRLLCELCGRRPPRARLPRAAMLAAGAGFSVLTRMTRRRVPFTFRRARQLVGCYGWYSSEKAAHELGYAWRPVRESAADAVAWFRGEAGWAADGRTASKAA